MVKVELNKKGEWEELPDNSPNGIYLNAYLKEKLDNVLHIQSKGWDAVILIDGKERSGKSTLAMTCGWYLSKKKMTIESFAKGTEDAKKKIRTLPDESLLIIDEGSLVFNSKESTSKENVELQKIMDVVGQKNMIFIIVLPSIFDSSKPIATRRSLFLLHTIVDEKWNRGQFAYFGEEIKEALYVDGKKNYNKYLKSPEFIGNFTIFEPPFNNEYLKLKQATLEHAMENNGDQNLKLKNEINKLKGVIYLLYKKANDKREAQRIIGKTPSTIKEIYAKYAPMSIPSS